MKKSDITILLVDDEPDILEIVRYNLVAEGYIVVLATNGLEAISEAQKIKPQLILMDLMMPKMDGLTACEKIREIPELADTLIAFLTARGEDYSQMAGFEAGADDYITKPIRPKVLVSKVKSLLRRWKNDVGEESLIFGNLVINPGEYNVMMDENEIPMPRKEFELLSLLASRPSKVFKREDIMDSIWGTEVIVGDRTIDVHIRKLREKLGDDRFKTIKGVGYIFVP